MSSAAIKLKNAASLLNINPSDISRKLKNIEDEISELNNEKAVDFIVQKFFQDSQQPVSRMVGSSSSSKKKNVSPKKVEKRKKKEENMNSVAGFFTPTKKKKETTVVELLDNGDDENDVVVLDDDDEENEEKEEKENEVQMEDIGEEEEEDVEEEEGNRDVEAETKTATTSTATTTKTTTTTTTTTTITTTSMPSTWSPQNVPFTFVSETLLTVTSTRSRLIKASTLSSALRRIISHDRLHPPPTPYLNSLAFVLLSSNEVGRVFNLGIGGSVISKALTKAFMPVRGQLSKLASEHGELGDAGKELFEGKGGGKQVRGLRTKEGGGGEVFSPHPPRA